MMCKLKYCKNKEYKEGYCFNHHANFIYTGDPLQTTKRHMGCIINDCNNNHYAKGLCKIHYNRDKYRNEPKYKENRNRWRKNNPEKILSYNKKYLEKIGKIFDTSCNEYKYLLHLWSKAIKKLDNNMCKLCDTIDNLHAHHIQPKKDFPELSFNLDNGITLCEKCHEEVHGFKFN